MRVLLVEDDSSMARSIEMMLKSEGYIVDTEEMGEDGLELGKIYEYDIIILDLMLPDMDGLALLRHLAEVDFDGKVAVISGLDSDLRIARNGKDACAYPVHKRHLVLAHLLHHSRADIFGMKMRDTVDIFF